MFLAEGFEETEAIGALDVIKRAQIEIKTVGIGGLQIEGAHGVSVIADVEEKDLLLDDVRGVILPGGMPGTINLEKSKTVIESIKKCYGENALIAAICAAPMILGNLGILDGKRAVCYPGFEKYLKGAKIGDGLTAADKNIITAKGAGAAMLFGAEIVNFFKEGAGDRILAEMQHI